MPVVLLFRRPLAALQLPAVPAQLRLLRPLDLEPPAIAPADDPNPSDSPEMVMNYYSNFYPELTTATVHGPVLKDDKAVYEFKTTVGTKG